MLLKCSYNRPFYCTIQKHVLKEDQNCLNCGLFLMMIYCIFRCVQLTSEEMKKKKNVNAIVALAIVSSYDSNPMGKLLLYIS